MDIDGVCYSPLSDQKVPYITAKTKCENGNYVESKTAQLEANDVQKKFQILNFSKDFNSDQGSISFWTLLSGTLRWKMIHLEKGEIG